MRCNKAWMLLVAALLLLAGSVPVSAWDGARDITERIKIEYGHPWQDENQGGGSPNVNLITGIPIGPIVITIDVELPTSLVEFFISPKPPTGARPQITAKKTHFQPKVVSRRSEVI